MFVTTFPCHNCAKHIIAAGIRRVIYLEPYPKSRANNLYREEIELETMDETEREGEVVFSPFSGIAPRQYKQLFSMVERGAKRGLSLKEWGEAKSSLLPKYVMSNAWHSNNAAECEQLTNLDLNHYRWNPESICPT
jgi:hypothetical protein